MMTTVERYHISALKSKIYIDLPSDDIGPARKLLEQYSGIPAEDVDGEIIAVREKLWAVKPYGCIARFRFINLSFTTDARYKAALERLKAPGSTDTFLDMACCIGQVLRQITFDGVDSSRLYGTDLEQEFLDLGYKLFRDKRKFRAMMVAGDILKGADDCSGGDDRLNVLDGKISIIHSQSFFHLFPRDLQVIAAKRIIRFLKPNDPNVVIYGREVGSSDPSDRMGLTGNTRYLHNASSWQRLWDEVGEQTGTKWRTEVEISDIFQDVPGKRSDGHFRPDGNNRISYGVYRA